jgi:putative transposase
MDALIGRKRKTKLRFKRRNLAMAIRRTRARLRHLIDEMHWQVANFLTKSFDVILIPHLETGRLAVRAKRKLTTKTARHMLTLGHYRFLQRLKQKAQERGKLVIECSEAYTSKTVSWTGEVNPRLGGAKIVRSQLDGQRMDRDLNGARGIFLRALADTPIGEHLRCIGTSATTPSAASIG